MQEKCSPIVSQGFVSDINRKVERLRALVAAGVYQVSAEKIAEAMLKEHRFRNRDLD